MNNDWCDDWFDVVTENNPVNMPNWLFTNPRDYSYKIYPDSSFLHKIWMNSGDRSINCLSSHIRNNIRNKNIIMKKVENKRKQKRTCKC
jgi:hypothetical protein